MESMIGEVRQMRIMTFCLRIMMFMHRLIIHNKTYNMFLENRWGEFSFHANFKVSLGLVCKLHFHENISIMIIGVVGCCYKVAEVVGVFLHYYVVARVFWVVARWLFTSKESPQSEQYSWYAYTLMYIYAIFCLFYHLPG